MRFPFLVFLLSFAGLALAVKIGMYLHKSLVRFDEEGRQDFSVIQASTLTLLGIIIGFTFSMAVSRYDLRKSCEEEEANAIGTEYLRLDLLPAADAAAAKGLVRKYLEQRIEFYEVRNSSRLEQISRDTAHLQSALWSAVHKGVAGQPAAVVSLTVSGLNDALNAEGYTQAAWLNRIPTSAWIMMETIAFFGSMLIGMGARRSNALVWFVLPFVMSTALFLIADLDSPRRGLIRIRPENLLSLADSLHVR